MFILSCIHLTPISSTRPHFINMNFGSKANETFKHEQPTYHIAPNFTTRPFPDGPLELGTLVEDIKQYYPINQGATNRVPIADGQRYSDVKENIDASVMTSHTGECSVLARVLDRSIGGEISLKGQRVEQDIYKINRLETVYFYPQRSYINKCLLLPEVHEYLEMGDYNDPVYLITGLKLAWGATVFTQHGKELDGKSEGGISVPGIPVDVDIKAKAQVGRQTGILSMFKKPADFVLGVQVQKIYHTKRFLSTERRLRIERRTRKAVLVDDEEDVHDDLVPGDENVENFVIANMDEDEVGELVL
ncbi:hypothetical protein F4678DRAFT_412228 [Xylaria arbuscula]|nr:hypothetical protein F4678DRAFT_412228 [Xylaria arbuscula]